ncbi:hypothetical protein Taro_004509 [Colocasia esculenta]|uniref:Protein kinase domain-containing protein n=1 Tax=Colocasia esculenta TaxID=4460 RepID=A0A843TIA9_COLES|nr:hypothetical protein [Colocasia esculenta]
MAKAPSSQLSSTSPSAVLVTAPRSLLLGLLFLVIPAATILSISQAVAATAEEEKQILLHVKAAWGDPASLSSWNSSSPSHCSGWNGVVCSRDGSVVSISLVDQGIVGVLPPAVGGLRNLSFLDLYNNSLGGGFPTPLYGCSGLQSLNLAQNFFVGPIPADVDRLSQLRVLDLSNNNFSGDVPAALTRISGLRILKLDNNLLNGTFPGELEGMAELEHLTLAYNPFAPTRIPPELGNLRKLKYLWMSDASLIGSVPETIANLTELEHLDLATNRLNGTIPGGIWGLEKLQNLYLFNNQLSGEIGGPVFRSHKLTEIDLSQNSLTGTIPDVFGELLSLRILYLYDNRLSGEIPGGIGGISTLMDIRLFNNRLTGFLPPELGNYSKLVNLEVFSNRLRGSLPENLCARGALNSLVAFENGFTGGLPESLGGCDTLENLQVYDNELSGVVSKQIWSLPHLSTVIMHGNALSGELPETLTPNLSRLEIGDNRFSGKVPSISSSLIVFKADNNSFSGPIPSNLSGMTQLQVLWLHRNQISGEIPASISSLSGLTDLNLSGNRLIGSIPPEIGSLQVLTSLDLSDNRLSGTIPSELGRLRLNSLNLSLNTLTGQVPPTLQNQAYNGSFLSNPGLCSSNPLLNIPACSGAKAGGSGGLSRGLLVLFLVLGVLFVLLLLFLGFLVVRDLRRRKGVADLASWKLTSFQSLDFTESTIIRGLTTENLIGTGGSGQVYRVLVSNRSGKVVAVKKIWSSKKVDSRSEREFQAEVRILSSIRHANIIKLLCCVSGTDAKLLVYEYMNNGSLYWWLHDDKGRAPAAASPWLRELDWSTRLSIAVGAASGLCYMHHDCSPPIVHRDVKSSNILLDGELRPKVADFGLARILVGSLEAETASAVAGSFGYMAPECAYSRKVSEKIDVYSFGVVLLELVTGKQANDGDGESCLAEWAWRHFQEGRPVVDAVDERIRDGDPRALEEMSAVLRLGLICTGTLPSTRPSMKEVLQVLTACGQKHGFKDKISILDYDVSPLPRDARKQSGRRRAYSRSGDVGREEEERSLASNV